ncbi:amidohydrolase [Anaeromyxobacter oryzae]|uniref:Amidohydrolase n=1 Tax=Anaeromyxobacter oryzae TaxID=2918170 RepID=A0ABM7X4E3_9BACT|nr:amidohydrolase [Anaeromyxobacter oryzae]BDG06660.1 amidohydrolase [Anaeromyxobacter oryzae]
MRPSDLLVAGTIHTLDPARPLAGAALLRDGRIACLGSEAECAARATPGAPRLALGAGCAIPGLVDAHGHVFWLGRAALEVSCAGAASAEACAALAAERARSTPAGRWIRGRGWDQNRWPGAAFPDAELLSRAVPGHPVFLTRVDGHMAWVNGAALEAAGIGAGTADPPGGRIARDAAGRPTGLLVDTAMDLVLRTLPRPAPAEREEALLAGLRALASLGLTGVHDAGCEPDVLDAYRRLAAADRLPLRVYAMIDGTVPLPELERALAAWRETPEVGLLEVRAVKLYADGALGSRGAALLDDYADDPGNRGLLLEPLEALRAKLVAVVRAGFQPAIHAIGDRANREVLHALREAGEAARALRPRIEHLQILQASDLPVLAATGAIASMQPVHATSDGPWVAARLGAGTSRLAGAYAWRSVSRAGAVLAFGSDFPVEAPDPRAGLHAAETRRTADGTLFQPEEAVSRLEALRAFTAGAAYAAFAEGRRGTLREGLDADLTLFGEDVLAVPPEALPHLTVTHTIVGGRIAFERGVARR